MRYFELIQKHTSKAKAISKTAEVIGPEPFQIVQIPAGSGAVHIRIVNGQVSIIKDKTTKPDKSSDNHA